MSLLLIIALLAGACSSSSADAQDGVGNSTDRTVAEEASTTVPSATASQLDNVTPLPDPGWVRTRFELQPIATLDSPTAMARKAGSDDLWVAEREGRIMRVERRVSSNLAQEEIKTQEEPVLDISERVTTKGEGGLLGIEFSLNGRFVYLSYTDTSGNSVVSEFTMNGNSADPESERIILTQEQPYSNHNGGDITFGPDGFLYIAFGDGGDSGDPDDNGQNLKTWLGKILRIDPAEPSEGKEYSIPGGNPFTNRSDVPDEIWLYGVRNPWRFSFDMATKNMWVADVGQNMVEEVTLLRGGLAPAGQGANLGWRTMEGELVFDDRGMADPTVALSNYVGPIHTYSHERGRCSVTGGYVYRGARLNTLRGTYVYSDYCSGELWGLDALRDGRAVWSPLNVTEGLESPVAFGQDVDGELYALQAGGDIVRLQSTDWRRTTRLVGPDEAFNSVGFESEVLPGNGLEERFDGPSNPSPPPVFGSTTTSAPPPTIPVDP